MVSSISSISFCIEPSRLLIRLALRRSTGSGAERTGRTAIENLPGTPCRYTENYRPEPRQRQTGQACAVIRDDLQQDDRVHIDHPALRQGQVPQETGRGSTAQDDLPPVSAAQASEEHRRGTDQVYVITRRIPPFCELLLQLISAAPAGHSVTVGIDEGDKPAEGRIPQLAPVVDLLTVECRIIVLRAGGHSVVLGGMGLDHNPPRPRTAPRPPRPP